MTVRKLSFPDHYAFAVGLGRGSTSFVALPIVGGYFVSERFLIYLRFFGPAHTIVLF